MKKTGSLYDFFGKKNILNKNELEIKIRLTFDPKNAYGLDYFFPASSSSSSVNPPVSSNLEGNQSQEINTTVTVSSTPSSSSISVNVSASLSKCIIILWL